MNIILKKCYIEIIFLLCLISFSNGKELIIYEIDEFFEIIENFEISEEDSKKLINSLTQILERYVYLDILKNPPQPSPNYHNRVDLINELKYVNTKRRPLYYFYRDVKAIIDSCQDLHLSINLNENINSNSDFNLTNFLFIAPLYYFISQKDVYSFSNEVYRSFDPDLANEIKSFELKPIKSINGMNPLEYIQKFNNNFRNIKSPQGQFVFNMNKIQGFSILVFPLDSTSLTNIHIVYEDDSELIYNYRVLYCYDNYQLGEYFSVPKNPNYFFYEFLKPKQNFYHILNGNEKEKIDWKLTYDNGDLKCTVDDNNKVNVIYQNTFFPSNLEESIIFFDECFSSFDNNYYPIIIIEDFNRGGYGRLADLLISYINLNKTSIVYSSYRYNEQTQNYVSKFYAHKPLGNCEIKYGTYFFNNIIKEDNYGETPDGKKLIHKRTEMFDSFIIDDNIFYNIRENTKYIRNPHEIIIFTDGFSFSATSSFIKHIQLEGGAIIVGYNGNPNLESFDASQSPTSVHRTNIKKDPLSKEIEELGFTLSYSIIEEFSELENGNKTSIPLEYIINEIDERIQIYYGYDDSVYQNFINEALKIFNKYKTRCNPKNKKLLFISEKCVFPDNLMHGGFECDDRGFWSQKCVPSYCDNGYTLDKINNKCVRNKCIKRNELYEYFRDISIVDGLKIFFCLLQICFIIGLYKQKKMRTYIFVILIVIIDISFIFFFYNQSSH